MKALPWIIFGGLFSLLAWLVVKVMGNNTSSQDFYSTGNTGNSVSVDTGDGFSAEFLF